MIKFIKRQILYEAQGDTDSQKVLAFLLLLRSKLGDVNFIKGYSRNKICKLTGCSDGTVKKYIEKLQGSGVVYFDKTKDGMRNLRLRRVSSGTSHRNTRIDGLCFKTFKDAFCSVRCLIHMLKLSAKEYVRQAIRIVNKPKKYPSRMKKDNFKKAKTCCKNIANPNPDGSYEYKEHGISYKTIAKYLGCTAKTAAKYISYGVKKRWFKKHKHEIVVHMPGVWKMDIPGFTYCTRNYGHIVFANSYELSPSWMKKLYDKSCLETTMTDEEYDNYMEQKKANTMKYGHYIPQIEKDRRESERIISLWRGAGLL